MTTSHLYAIYLGAYAEAARHFGDGYHPGNLGLVCPASLSSIERAMADLALLDATNGTRMRSRSHFERSLHGGTSMLLGLEQRDRRSRPGLVQGRFAALPPALAE